MMGGMSVLACEYCLALDGEMDGGAGTVGG